MPQLSINLLGSFQVQLDGESVTGFDSDKVRALLAILVVEPDRPQRRERLAGLLWPGFSERSARTNLRSALSNLRKTLGDQQADPPYLNVTRNTIQFNLASQSHLDVAEFVDALEQEPQATQEIDRLEGAVQLYRGEFLAGFSIPDSPEFEEWALVTREALRRQALDALRRLAGYYEDRQQYGSALAYARRVVDLEPLDESGHRQVMRLLALSGRRSEALAAYESLKSALSTDLGVTPAESTTALYLQVRNGVFQVGVPDVEAGAIRGYTLRERLGVGHFGAVYRAYQAAVERDVAVKVILPRHADRPDFIRRFETEAQLIARLEHPYIVPLYDYWREPRGAYLVMRWLRGGSLKSDLEKGPWSGEAAVRLVQQVAGALDWAHTRGVVHRDVKPGNILLDEEDNAYLSDFGIAALLDLPGARMSQPDDLATGSLGYLSPEGARGEETGPLADIYSLGVVVYELLTGEPPFLGVDGEALVEKHLKERLPSVRERRPELPAAVDDVIQQATAKDPGDRYASARDLAIALREVLAVGGAPAGLVTIKDVSNPYKGLRAFQEADAADFFGREALVERLVARLAKDPFLAVVGPSGSGKSSVVRAGLLPALRAGGISGSERWFFTTMSPGTNPFEELEVALLRVAVNPPESLQGQIRENERGLLQAVKRCLPANEDQLLLVIDQFEELFTLVGNESERQRFLEGLLTAVADIRGNLRVVVTLRADFYDRPLGYEGFGELIREHTEVVLPLSTEELAEAITGPAKQAGVIVNSELVGEIIAAVRGQPGTLPLLQYALTELFERREDGQLTLGAYHAMDGVMGALTRRAEALHGDLDREGQNAARQIFLRLVTLGEGMEDTRRRVLRSEFQRLTAEGLEVQTLNAVLNTYGQYRLMTFDRDPATREPTVEIAHEALLREWIRLREWIDANRTDVRLQRALAVAAAEWRAAGRDPSFLLRGARLDQFTGWAAQTQLALTDEERGFLKASADERRQREQALREQQQRERALEQAALRRLRIIVGVLIAASIMGILLTAAIFNQSRIASRTAEQNALIAATAQAASNQADAERRVAESERNRAAEEAQARATQQALAERSAAEARSLALAASARLALNASDTDLAIALAVEANLIPDPLVDVQLALADAAYTPGTRYRLAGHTNPVYSVAVSPDELSALSGSSDRTVIWWDLVSAEIIRQFGGFRGSVSSVRFLPDGKTALVGVLDGSLRLLDLETGRELRRFIHYPPLPGAALNSDGRTVLWASPQGQLRSLDLESGETIRDFGESPREGSGQAVTTVAFTPDGSEALAGGVDGRLVLWDVGTGQEVRSFGGSASADLSTSAIESLAVSSDGQRAVSVDANGQVVLWDLETGSSLHRYQGAGPEARVFSVAIHPGGKTALVGTAGGSLTEWSLDSGETIRSLGRPEAGHTGWVTDLAYNLDGSRALSSGTDGRLILWDLDQGRLIRHLGEADPTGNRPPMLSVAISPDGRTVLSGDEVGVMTLWDLDSGATLRTYERGFGINMESVDFTPDGEHALTVTLDGVLTYWDLSSGEQLSTITGPPAAFVRLSIGKNGQSAVSTVLSLGGAPASTRDLDAIIWDLSTGEQDGRLTSPPESPIVLAVIGPDGDVALSGGQDGLVILWDLESETEIVRLLGHERQILDLAFSPDGRLGLSGGVDAGLILWDLESGQVVRRFPISLNPESVAFSSDGGTVFAGQSDGTIFMWDVNTGVQIGKLTGHSGFLWEIDIFPSGRQALTAATDGDVRLWDLASGAEVKRLVQPGPRSGAAYHPSEPYALTSAGGDLLVWDLETGEVVRSLGGHSEPVFDIKFNKDGSRVLSSAGDPFREDTTSLILWDFESGAPIRRLDGQDQIFSAGFTPDERFAIVPTYGSGEFPGLFLWDLATGEVVRRFKGIEDDLEVGDADMSPDGRQVLASMLNKLEIRVWDLATGEELHRFPVHEFSIPDIAISPDGQQVLSASWDRTLLVSDVESGAAVWQNTRLGTELFTVAISQDGLYALAGGGDGSLFLLDFQTGEVIRELKGHQSIVIHVAFSPDGRQALSASFDGSLRLWRVDRTLEELTSWMSANRYVRGLTCDERKLYNVIPLC